MLNKVLLNLTLGAVGLVVLWPVYAAAPAKIADVAPVGDLVHEADAKIKALEEHLASDKSFNEGKGSSIPRDAGVLAVLAQAISESSESSPWQASAKDVRDGAIAVWSSKSFDDAKKGLEKIKAAHAGKAGDAKPEHDWNKLCKLGSLMKELSARNGKLRSATKKKQMTPQEMEESSRHASVLAVLGLAAEEDTHEVKKKEEVGEWKKFAKAFQSDMHATSEAFKKGDMAAAAAAWKKGNSACNECHMKFKENE